MTTPSVTTSPPTPDVRLRLSEAAGGRLGGAWWPRSRDLAAELPGLLDHFPVATGHVDRVLFSRPDWNSCPRTVDIGRGRIKTGSFPSDDSHLLILRLSTKGQLALLVVPPDSEPDVADRLMARAAARDNRSTGSELLAAETGLSGGSHDAAESVSEDPPSAHNAAVDEGAARRGQCAQVHLPTGDTCALHRGHEGSCAFGG